jgi:carboxymethylenebutenolidase
VVVSREYVDIPVGELRMRTYLAVPRGGGRYPGIVFFSDIFQLTEPTLRWATRLAGHGFAVAAPEIYHRIEPPGTVLEFDDGGKERGQGDAEKTPVADFDTDILAAVSWLREQPFVDGASLGAAGHCTGGHLAFRAALLPQVKATACWYATGVHDGKLGADADAGSLARAGEIRGSLLMVWGSADPHTPQDGRETIRAALEDAGTRFAWSVYPAAHAFGRDVGERYDPRATDAAFAETIALFERFARV